MSPIPGPSGRRRPGRCVSVVLAVFLLGLGSEPTRAAPPKPLVLAVLGSGADGARLAAATAGIEKAAGAARGAMFEGGVAVRAFDDGGTEAGLKGALRRLKASKPVGVIALPMGSLFDAYWKAARSVRVPWVIVSGMPPDLVRNPGNVLLLGPTPVGQGVAAADAMLAPLAARRVAVLHEPTELGQVLAAAFARSLSPRVKLAGVRAWSDEDDPGDILTALHGFEADWHYVAMTGRYTVAFAKALKASDWQPRCLFCDGARDESALAEAGGAFANCVFLDGPDPELTGRLGERLVEGLELEGAPIDTVAVRAYEGARRILVAIEAAGKTKFGPVWKALAPEEPNAGVLGVLHFAPHGGIRLFPRTYWRVKSGRFAMWPQGLLPTEGCGPPLGFRLPPPADVNAKKGRIGYLTYGDGDTRTIEQDLLECGLQTNGREKDLDQLVRDEILARAIRIAHRLFRREPDGTPIPGWSWGMTFTTTKPDEKEVPRHKVWLAIVAGDHPAAGGQVIGSGMVAVYSTFLKRTMYASRKLTPPISADDRHLLDGSYRWGEHRANNRRADEIRCLIDGFASAVGLTLAHEFGHLCGCGHDTEHPTSIMNVVAGAGATWESAVWIPKHQRNLTTTLAIEGVTK